MVLGNLTIHLFPNFGSFETFTILETKGSRLSENMVNETQVSKVCPVIFNINFVPPD